MPPAPIDRFTPARVERLDHFQQQLPVETAHDQQASPVRQLDRDPSDRPDAAPAPGGVLVIDASHLRLDERPSGRRAGQPTLPGEQRRGRDATLIAEPGHRQLTVPLRRDDPRPLRTCRLGLVHVQHLRHAAHANKMRITYRSPTGFCFQPEGLGINSRGSSESSSRRSAAAGATPGKSHTQTSSAPCRGATRAERITVDPLGESGGLCTPLKSHSHSSPLTRPYETVPARMTRTSSSASIRDIQCKCRLSTRISPTPERRPQIPNTTRRAEISALVAMRPKTASFNCAIISSN